jgi:hypothetical protein
MKLGLKDLEHSLFGHGRPGRKMEDWSRRGTAAGVSLQSNEFSGPRIQPDRDPDYVRFTCGGVISGRILRLFGPFYKI